MIRLADMMELVDMGDLKSPTWKSVGVQIPLSAEIYFWRFKMEQTNNRVRMNVSLTSKGTYQFEITSESDNVETSKKLLSEAVDSLRAVMKEKGIEEAGK